MPVFVVTGGGGGGGGGVVKLGNVWPRGLSRVGFGLCLLRTVCVVLSSVFPSPNNVLASKVAWELGWVGLCDG